VDRYQNADRSSVRTEQAESLEVEPLQGLELRVEAALRAWNEHLDENLFVIDGMPPEQRCQPSAGHLRGYVRRTSSSRWRASASSNCSTSGTEL
jgi:hypothetical protein